MSTTPDGPEGQHDPYRDPTAPSWVEPATGQHPGPPGPPQAPSERPAAQQPPAPAYPTQEQLQQGQAGQPAYPGATPPPPAEGPYPYGQHGYGQQGYGRTAGSTGGYPGYGQNTAGYGYPPAGAVSYGQNQTNGSALALTIVSAVTILFCGGLLTIPAVVFGGIALSRQNTDPESSRQLARNGWIAYGIGVVLTIVLGIALVAWIVTTADTYSSSTFDSGY